MGGSLAVTLANNWMKSFEGHIKSTKEIINKISKNDLEACPECNRKITYRRKQSNVRSVKISSMQKAKIFMINFTQNEEHCVVLL